MTSASVAIDMASTAIRPWHSIDAASSAMYAGDSTTQDEKDFCLDRCPFAANCAACEHCDGRGNIKERGRPRMSIDEHSILNAIKTHKVAAVGRMYGVSRSYIYRLLREVRGNT